jgi:hypothetical protein
MLSGSTITWDNVGVYQESVHGLITCVPDGVFCDLAITDFPRIMGGCNDPPLGDGNPPPDPSEECNDVPLPKFTLHNDSFFGDRFVSDNGTPGNDDDIDRPDLDATVKDTWEGKSLPEPSGETLLLAGVLGLAGLARLRERGGAVALFASLFASRR